MESQLTPRHSCKVHPYPDIQQYDLRDACKLSLCLVLSFVALYILAQNIVN